MQHTTYELKYCERCGSLGLRRSQSAENYCEPCGQILTTYLPPADWRRRSVVRQPGTEAPTPLKLQGVTLSGRLQ